MSNYPVTIPDEVRQVVIDKPPFRPLATYVILGLNLLIFILMTLAGGSQKPEVLLDFGASYGPYIRRGEYWRLVMPMFLHIGMLHLVVNAYALYILGPILERVYGYARFSLLYVGAGISGSFLSMVRSNNVAAGASGAIFGIAGSMLVTGYLHREAIPPRWGRAFGKGILPFIVVNLIFGFSVSMIDNWGHLGGLLGGMLLGLLIAPPERRYMPGSAQEEPSQAILVIPVIVVALAMGATADHYRVSRTVLKLLQEGHRLRSANQYAPALARFQEAARRAPRDERPHEEIGSLYLEQKHFDEAIREYNDALRLNPDAPQARLGLALAYRQKGDLPKARQLFEAVLGKNPESPESQTALADLYAEQKLYQEAIQHYQQALRLRPDLAEAHNNLAWLLATSEDPRFRNARAALEHAQAAVNLTKWKQAAFVDTLAEAHYANGDFAEAVRIQTKALELDPHNRELQDHMARYRKAAGA